MPLVQSSSKKNVSENIRRLESEGKRPHKQNVAIALDIQRRNMSDGGMAPPGMATGGDMSWQGQQAAETMDERYHPGGLIVSDVAGRTDRLPLAVPADSHVIPADVVSGFGQGNTMTGAKLIDEMLKAGPMGASTMPRARGAGPPAAPPAMKQEQMQTMPGMARGGAPHSSILAAGGEYVVPRDAVARIGAGDLNAGHKMLDVFIKRVRDMQQQFLRSAPAPKK